MWKVREYLDKATNVVMNYTDMEAKVREATNDEAWGPTGQIMQELAQATYSYESFPEIMSMLWRRMLIDNQYNWRRPYKALVLLNYLVKNGHERVVTSSREHIYDLKGLKNYTFTDDTGKDCGVNVRLKVQQLIDYINDDDALREERKKAKKNRDKYVGVSSDGFGLGNRSHSGSFHDAAHYERDQSMSYSDKTPEKESNNKRTIPQNVPTNVEKPIEVTPPNELIQTIKPKVSETKQIDLLGGIFDHERPKSVEQNSAVTDSTAELKQIVKNIDIFSNKIPKPPKARSKVPDLTSKNPAFARPRDSRATASTSKLTVKPKQQEGNLISTCDLLSQSLEVPSEIKQAPLSHQFDLLSVEETKDNLVEVQKKESNPKPGTRALQDLTTLNEPKSDPFDLADLLSPSSSTLVPTQLGHTTIQPPTVTQLITPSKPSPAAKKLPDTWNSLVSGTNFELDIDNLLKPISKNKIAPTLNQLAIQREQRNNDLI